MSVETRVVAIIEDRLGVDEDKITPEASIIHDLRADELDILELVMDFEKEFNINIPDEDAEKLKTVGGYVRYIEKKLKN